MRTTKLVIAMVMMLSVSAYAAPLRDHPATDMGAGWRLGTQAYTFNRFTFFEAVDKAAQIGLDWIEAYPGQRLCKELPEAKMHHTMPAGQRELVQKKLAESGIRLVCYGVVGLPNNEEECRRVFNFCKIMGIENIASEPPEDAFDLIDRLCREYRIAVAIHNHPKPSHYWNPDTVLKVCQGRSKWIGACADTGHWMRSGVNPLEAVKQLQAEKRIIYFHLKDLNEFGIRNAHDVPWGKGKANMPLILKYLAESNFRGVFSAEYEHNWLNSVPELQQCAKFFNQASWMLKPSGWKPLLKDDLSNAQFKPGSWTLENDVLARQGGGYIWTKERFGDFILDLEFKVVKGANSGVFIRTGNLRDLVQNSIEVQIHDTGDGATHGDCGAIYNCLSPSKKVTKPAGAWNHMTIQAMGPMIYVVMNGVQIIDMNVNEWDTPHKNKDGSRNKFSKAIKDMPREGFIGFQDHGQPVWYRHVRIKKFN